MRPNVLVIGPTWAVGQLVHQLEYAGSLVRVIGHVSTEEHGAAPCGVDQTPHRLPKALGRFDELEAVLSEHRPDRVLLNLPVVMAEPIRQASRILDRQGIAWSFVPTLADQLAGRVAAPVAEDCREAPDDGNAEPPHTDHMLTIRPTPAGAHMVDPVQLIGRRPRELDEQAIRRTLTGKVVLITGAGGSIGSELARIVGRFQPERLVLVERSENSLFEVDRLLRRLYPDRPPTTVLHDVANSPRTLAVVTAQKPHVIFHAAAHKHVPMMEDHPDEAVENNFYGTRAIADAAARNAVERFVMISSDKAVNPSSVMGATKRLAELYIQNLNTRSDTLFSMVRFGNVLGSACSILPIWSQQIAQNLPVTVTHPDMTRYFMTIPEAAGLVIQSAAFAGESDSAGGEVFLLDMGEPISILDLARRFIQSQGLVADRDVPIEFTGIRPGEKLFEELAYSGEDMLPTPHASIRLWRTEPPSPGRMRQIVQAFDELRQPSDADAPAGHRWQHATRDQILTALRQAVPEMATPTLTG